MSNSPTKTATATRSSGKSTDGARVGAAFVVSQHQAPRSCLVSQKRLVLNRSVKLLHPTTAETPKKTPDQSHEILNDEATPQVTERLYTAKPE